MSKKKYDNQNTDKSDNLELVLLRTINNEYEFNLIKDLLEEHEIPYIVRDHGIGGYMRIISGSSIYRTDILVEKSMFENAKNILDELALDE